LDPGVDLHIGQLFREGMVRTSWPWVHPYGHLLLVKQLNSVAEKGLHPFALRTTNIERPHVRVASIWCIRGPIEGARHPQSSYLSPDREVSFTSLYVGRHLAIRVFLLGITLERCLKPPGLDLIRGVGISPYLILWRGTCSGWLSPMNGDLGSI
jgi:hypothetical protein